MKRGIDMTKPTNRKKRNKLTVALLAPILIIVFIVGWSLYWIRPSGRQCSFVVQVHSKFRQTIRFIKT